VFFLVAIILLAASHQKTQGCENWQVIDQQINFTGGSNLLFCYFFVSDLANVSSSTI
jgi:hypothetical protein